MRPPTILVEFLADRGRLEQELAVVRDQAAAGDAQSREALSRLAEQLAVAASALQSALDDTAREVRLTRADLAENRDAVKRDLVEAAAAVSEDVSRAQAAIQERLAERFDGLARDVGKLGREQFRATTLLEGHGETLDELADAWREHLRQREREAADFRQALGVLESQVRLGVVKDLLPVADALDQSIRSARELLPKLQPEPAPLAPRAVPERGPTLWERGLARLWGGVPLARRGDEEMGRGGVSEAHTRALESWIAGLLLVERRLLALLDREQVQPIPAVGQTFDPHLHQAVGVQCADGVPEGTVVGEELRGYTVGDRVLRHAEVVVARGENDETAGAPGQLHQK